MKYKKGDIIGPSEMGCCPNCDDGDLDTEGGEIGCYTYYCHECGWEMDVEIIHTVSEVRKP